MSFVNSTLTPLLSEVVEEAAPDSVDVLIWSDAKLLQNLISEEILIYRWGNEYGV